MCFFLKKTLKVINSEDIVYSIPSRFIKCRYIRIHITNVEKHDELLTKTSGLIINEIYGQDSPSDSSTLGECSFFNQFE